MRFSVVGDVMSNFEHRSPGGDPEQNKQPEPNGEPSRGLDRLKPPEIIAPRVKIENFFEGELADILLVKLGVCDPDILDHLTSIEIEGVSTGALVPLHPETGQRIKTIGEAYTIGQERDRFEDGYVYAEFQERLGRTTLFHLACVESGHQRRTFDRALEFEGLLDLDALGKVSYGRAAVEGYELRDARTGVWQTIYENFEICRHALALFHKQLNLNLG